MQRRQFDDSLRKCKDDGLIDFARKFIVHGTPHVFKGREDDFYEFRNRIGRNFGVGYYQVYIVGSAKLGFSYVKGSTFSYESDIDVAIVSEELYNTYLEYVREFQYELDSLDRKLTTDEYDRYIRFLKYMAKGWMRPDLLPRGVGGTGLKESWFDFFNSISYNKSEVGNYKVCAGVYKNYSYLESYTVNSLKKHLKTLKVEDESKNG